MATEKGETGTGETERGEKERQGWKKNGRIGQGEALEFLLQRLQGELHAAPRAVLHAERQAGHQLGPPLETSGLLQDERQ